MRDSIPTPPPPPPLPTQHWRRRQRITPLIVPRPRASWRAKCWLWTTLAATRLQAALVLPLVGVRVITRALHTSTSLRLHHFRDLLEVRAYKLADQRGMHDLIPFVAEEEHKQIKKEVEGRDVSVIFDGTTRLGEALAVINPRRACAARVTVLGLCVCVSVCVCVCLHLFSHYRQQTSS